MREEDEPDVRCCLCLRRTGHARLSKSDGGDDVRASAKAGMPAAWNFYAWSAEESLEVRTIESSKAITGIARKRGMGR